jgi:CRP-like cAMP-binding protein/HEAT repeat protein
MRWRRLNAVCSWLNIEPGEVRPVGLCFAIAFTWGFAQMFNWTASTTLFLKYFTANELPLISVAGAVLIPLSGLFFIRLGRTLRFSTLFLLFAVLFGTAPLVFWFLFHQEGGRWPAMAFAVWYYLEVAFATMLLDALLNRLFNLRQARRVFGPIATGADIAGLPAGALLALIVSRTGVENLLLVSVFLSLLVILAFLFVLRHYPDRMQPEAPPPADDDGQEGSVIGLLVLLRNPLVLCILALGALQEFSLEFINNAFYNRAEAFLTDPEQMASFLGRFFAVASILSAVVQMLASSRLMTLLGMGGCLVLGPALVALMLILFIGSSLSDLPLVIVFSCMAGAKFVQFTVMANINSVTQFTLIRSLSPAQRDRVLALSGTVMSPLLAGLSGLTLLGMIHYLQATAVGIALTAALILAVRIVVGVRTARLYRLNLKQMLNNRVLTGVELPLDDPATAETLKSMIDNPNPQTALSALALYGREAHAGAKPVLLRALQHPDPTVRNAAAGMLERMTGPEDLGALAEVLARETDAATVVGLLMALGRSGGSQVQQQLSSFFRREEPEIRAGACAALILHGDSAGARLGRRELEKLVHGAETRQRAAAAAVMGKIRRSEFETLLLPLLADRDLEVRRLAIEAAAVLGRPGLGAAVLANVTDPDLRPTVVRSLTEGSATMLPAIEEMYNAPGQSLALKLTIVELYGRIHSEASIEFLKGKMGEQQRVLQRAVLRALVHNNFRPRPGEGVEVDSSLLRTAECAVWLMACIAEFRRSGAGEAVVGALQYELHKIRDAMLMLLGFLYPVEALRFVRFAYLHSRSEERVAAAVELLENLLSREHRRSMLPILEPGASEQRLRELSAIFPVGAGGLAVRAGEILACRFGCESRWLLAVTLDFMARTGIRTDDMESPLIGAEMARVKRWLEPLEYEWQGTACAGLSLIERVAALKRPGIFALVPEEILADYAETLTERRLASGVTVIRRGENSSTACFIVEGGVRIHIGSRVIAELHAGDVFGELSALDPEPRSADAETLDETRLLEMEADTVQRMIAERGEAGEGIIRMLCRRIQASIREGAFTNTGRFTPVEIRPPESQVEELDDVEKAVLLKGVEIFSTLPEAILMHLATLTREQWLDAGTTLFRQGDFGTSMYVIVSGEVVVHDSDQNVIATLRHGEIIGELALLTSEVRSSSVTAVQPLHLLRISQSAFNELMWDHRQVARSLIRILAHRLRGMAGGPNHADDPIE